MTALTPVTRRRWRITPLTAFLLVLLAVFGGYAQMAMELEWRTEAGRIGPGFFPRLIGLAGMVLCAAAVVRNVLRPDTEEAAPASRHRGALLLVVAAQALVLFTLVPLGAVLTCVAFLFLVLELLDRTRPLLNLAVSVLVPLGLYLLFNVALGAGLPQGPLPF
ncbi:MAG: hypothetical protein GEU98_07410 [Pseudonocardiaceae bacterium]|nr:hypothetical protein [Pseudonocardiaceae bacterium]